jgi:sec-independent protein translocase protein TatA
VQGWELFVVVGIVVLLFGASRLPKMARSLGEARVELEKVRREAMGDDDDDAAPAAAASLPVDSVVIAQVPSEPVVVTEPVVTEPDRTPLRPPLPPPGS